MSAIPALLAVQISLSASTRRSYGGGLSSRTSGFRSLSDRGLDLKGWRSVAYGAFVVACLLAFVVLVIATIGGGIALSALIASSFSPWWLLATLPLSVAADAGVIWLMLRVLLG